MTESGPPFIDPEGRPVDRLHFLPAGLDQHRALVETPDGWRLTGAMFGITPRALAWLAQQGEGATAPRDLQGAIRIGDLHYRYQSSVTARGWHHALRRIGKAPLQPGALGLDPAILPRLLALRPPGLVLVCGDIGSGKTTTVSSLFAHGVAASSRIGFTVEDPPEFDLAPAIGPEAEAEGGPVSWVIQTEPPLFASARERGAPPDWAAGIAASLRSDPTHLLIGEIRDPGCAAAALGAAIAGPLVFATIHGADIGQALTRLARLAADAGIGLEHAREQAAQCLRAVIHQRRPSAERAVLAERASQAAAGQTAIVRRTPEFEVLTVDGEQENAIRSRLRAGMDLADEIRLQKARGRR